jgi:hypothetical protein
MYLIFGKRQVRLGVQRRAASEGCSSKAGLSWALTCLADHEPPHSIRLDLDEVLPSLPTLMYVRPAALVLVSARGALEDIPPKLHTCTRLVV